MKVFPLMLQPVDMKYESFLSLGSQYLLNYQLKEMTLGFDFNVVDEKFEKSIKKIAAISLKYSVNALLNETSTLAKKYWHLSLAIAPELEDSSLAQALSEAIETGELDLIQNLEIANFDKLRSESYKPDPPFEQI